MPTILADGQSQRRLILQHSATELTMSVAGASGCR
jgi:hypothetical protein